MNSIRSNRLARLLAKLTGAAALASLFASASCVNVPDENRFTAVLYAPDYPIYKANVDEYLSRRCGTLDCHGQEGRAYRIYGRTGLRLYIQDAGLISGEQATTDQERQANYAAIIGLEPEMMNRVMAENGADPERLLFLRKPLKLERHKGGTVISGSDQVAGGDKGYQCLTAWLRAPVGGSLTKSETDACESAAALP